MDFTIKTYRLLLQALIRNIYTFLTFEELVSKPKDTKEKIVVIRHDVDRIPKNALIMAWVESEMKIKTSYYFRVVQNIWNEEVIRKIVSLGHEVSYHYEDLAIAKGDYNKAISHFEFQLSRFRQIYPSKTICMHGSPMSKWDNRKLWDKFNYRDYGIIAEPYFDVDYSDIFYITDTGRQWNNENSNVRDIVNSAFSIKISDTKNIFSLLNENKMPHKIMINTHPHRWFDFGFGWLRELIMQNIKNVEKK